MKLAQMKRPAGRVTRVLATMFGVVFGLAVGALYLPRLTVERQAALGAPLSVSALLAFALQSSELVRIGRFAWAALSVLLALASVFAFGAYVPGAVYGAIAVGAATCLACAFRRRSLAYWLVWLGCAVTVSAKLLALKR